MGKIAAYFNAFLSWLLRRSKATNLSSKQKNEYEIQGFDDALNNVPIDEGIEECKKDFARKEEDINKVTQASNISKEDEIARLDEGLKETNKESTARHEAKIENQKSTDIAKANSELEDHKASVNADEDKKDEAEIKHKHIVKKLGSAPDTKTFIDRLIPKFIFLAFLFGMEFLASLSAFRDAKLNEDLAIGLSIALPLIIAISGELAGFMLSRGKWTLAISFLVVGMASIAVIYYYRSHSSVEVEKLEYTEPIQAEADPFVFAAAKSDFQFFDTETMNDLNVLPLTVINIVLFLLILIISYVFSSRREYWVNLKRIEKIKTRLKKSKAFIAQYPEYLEKIKKDYSDRAKMEALKEKQAQLARKAKLEKEVKEGILKVEQNKVSQDALGEIAIYHYKKGYREGERKRRTPKGGTTASAFIGIALMLGSSSCSDERPNRFFAEMESSQSYDQYVFLLDKSISMPQATTKDLAGFFAYIKGEIGFSNDDVSFKGIRITLSTIDGVNTTPVTELQLREVPFTERNWEKRKTEIRKFLGRLRLELERWYAAPAGAEDTYLNEILSYHLKNLTQSNAEHKTLVLISDCIQDSPYLDFEEYENDLKRFRNSFQEIADSLYRQNPIGKLDGINILIVHQTYNTRWDRLSHTSKEFWDAYLTVYGARVKVIPNFN